MTRKLAKRDTIGMRNCMICFFPIFSENIFDLDVTASENVTYEIDFMIPEPTFF
jgi:hypothetical protein